MHKNCQRFPLEEIKEYQKILQMELIEGVQIPESLFFFPFLTRNRKTLFL